MVILLISLGDMNLLWKLVNYQKVRVWNTDSLHGDSPFTEQPGECGEEGDYIQVKNFLRTRRRKMI